MIILNKKRIFLSMLVIAISIFTFTIQTAETDKINTVQTVALPVSNKVIVIDARTWNSR